MAALRRKLSSNQESAKAVMHAPVREFEELVHKSPYIFQMIWIKKG